MNDDFPLALALGPQTDSGRLIVLCGTDGAGKTSVLSGLARILTASGVKTTTVAQPSGFVRSHDAFRRNLAGDRDGLSYRALSMLVMSDRVRSMEEEVLPRLSQGETVLLDRYVYSQAARLVMHGDPTDQWFVEACKHLPTPQAVIMLHARPEVLGERLSVRNYETTSAFAFNELLRMQELLLLMAARIGIPTLDTSDLKTDQAVTEAKRILITTTSTDCSGS